MHERIFLSPPHMSGREQEYIAEAFASNYIAPLGAFVERFEKNVREYVGARHALATVNATAALHLALRIVGVEADDIVLASSFTFIGSVAPIHYQCATPIFIDSDEESWNLDPKLLKEAIMRAPKKPKALIVTHLYGQPASIEEIAAICKESGVVLIEDAAESLGATYKDRQSGTFGDIGIYSFNGNKLLSTSGGGMLVTDNETYYEKASFYATQAKEDTLHYEHKEYGYNYRLSNILGAIGVAQTEVLDERIAQARAVFNAYQKRLGDIEEVRFMPEIAYAKGNRWLTTLTLEHTDPATVIDALAQENIEARPLWKPMHLQPLYTDAAAVTNGVGERLFAKGLCLPSGTQLRSEQIDRICEIVTRKLA